MKKITLMIIWTLAFLNHATFAQDQAYGKHPKVIEVEMILSKEATAFLQQRIPNEPVYVNVEIEPLRRSSENQNEQLPYFNNEDEVGDEWDVIDTPMVLLLSRIKKTTIKVEVPSHISDIEISDLKEKLYEHLKLIPIRDSITFNKKIVATQNTSEAKDYSLYYFIVGIAIVVFFGLFFVLKFTNSKNNISTIQSTDTPTGSQSNSQASLPMRSQVKPSIITNASINSKVNGDINFKDSIRAADMLKEKLHGVINSPAFPLLSDMLILEELAQKSLSSLGAFIFEMPRKHQQKVFFRGRSDKWFRGYVEAASVDMECFLAVDKMLRNRTASGPEKWEELLIQIWRLDEEAYLFLKQIPAEEAFSILAFLPKSFSVPCAKKTFPGGWARVLEATDSKPIEDEVKLDSYLERTLQLKPYFSFKSIDDYKKDLELVDYLSTASPKDEEDVYESLSSTSNIHKIRPPFYLVFRADDDSFKNIFDQYDVSEWATAVLNAPRDYIKRVMNELDDKKKYMFSTYLKQLDENQPSIKSQIELREDIARTYFQYQSQKQNTKKTNNQDGMNNENESFQAA